MHGQGLARCTECVRTYVHVHRISGAQHPRPTLPCRLSVHHLSGTHLRAVQVAGHSEGVGWVRDAGKPVIVNKAQIREAVDKSLARLQTDCIDLYQIHWPERWVPSFGKFKYDPSQRREDSVGFEEQLEGLQDIIKEGKVCTEA